ncbi:MAG: SDR family NAD(P)-dependent oxidoreductase [Niastella sp.]|nr:SDR family NAD(P)-dependent oxidoreductase [Niastella sp.]
MKLENNTILITGGTSGFGLEFASRLLKLGNTVIITGRNLQKLHETKLQLPAVHIIQSDVSKAEDIEALYDQVVTKFPDLNILINNAGEMRKLVLHDGHDLQDITREVEINLMGPIRMVQQFLPHLKKKKTAAILNVTSGIALMFFPLAPVYSASKSGLRSYTQSLRVQVKNTAIKVFELVAPGSPTPLNDKFRDVDGFNPKMLMPADKIIDAAIRGMQKDKYEIYPGLMNVFRYIIRLAPGLLLSMTSKIGAKDMYGSKIVSI